MSMHIEKVILKLGAVEAEIEVQKSLAALFVAQMCSYKLGLL